MVAAGRGTDRGGGPGPGSSGRSRARGVPRRPRRSATRPPAAAQSTLRYGEKRAERAPRAGSRDLLAVERAGPVVAVHGGLDAFAQRNLQRIDHARSDLVERLRLALAEAA